MKSLFSNKTLFLLFSFFLICFFLFFSGISSAFAMDAIGQMVWVKGKVEAIDPSNKTRLLRRRSPIYVNDTILTGAGSGQIIFTDNSLVALREGTTFKIDQYKYNPSAPSDNKYVAGVAKGGFRTITGLISKSNPDGYEVHTPVATIGVRGTVYTIYYSAGTGLAVRLDRGALFVANNAGRIELNKARNIVYSETSGLNTKPAVTSTPPSTLSGQPAVVPATLSPSSTGSVSGSTIEPTNITQPTTIPKGTVDQFCIN